MAGVSKTVEEDQAGRVFATGRHNNRVAVTSAHSAFLLSFLSSFFNLQDEISFSQKILVLQIVSKCAFVFTYHFFRYVDEHLTSQQQTTLTWDKSFTDDQGPSIE